MTFRMPSAALTVFVFFTVLSLSARAEGPGGQRIDAWAAVLGMGGPSVEHEKSSPSSPSVPGKPASEERASQTLTRTAARPVLPIAPAPKPKTLADLIIDYKTKRVAEYLHDAGGLRPWNFRTNSYYFDQGDPGMVVFLLHPPGNGYHDAQIAVVTKDGATSYNVSASRGVGSLWNGGYGATFTVGHGDSAVTLELEPVFRSKGVWKYAIHPTTGSGASPSKLGSNNQALGRHLLQHAIATMEHQHQVEHLTLAEDYVPPVPATVSVPEEAYYNVPSISELESGVR